MDFRKTQCFNIRYGPIADLILDGGNVLWSHCQPGLPGTARVFAQLPNGKYVYLTWTYGISPGHAGLMVQAWTVRYGDRRRNA